MTADERASRVWAGLWETLFDMDDRKREISQTLDLSFVRVKALRRLLAGPLPMRVLAHKLVTDAPYTTILVDDLEARGLVTRTVNPNDKRTKTVAITESGRIAAQQAEAILDRPPEALAALSDEDLAALERVVAVLRSNVGT
jgi:DNA-binding MarR family transcriptional regulator